MSTVTHAVAHLENQNANHMEIPDENHLNQSNGYSTGTDKRFTNGTEVEERFESEECF